MVNVSDKDTELFKMSFQYFVCFLNGKCTACGKKKKSQSHVYNKKTGLPLIPDPQFPSAGIAVINHCQKDNQHFLSKYKHRWP